MGGFQNSKCLVNLSYDFLFIFLIYLACCGLPLEQWTIGCSFCLPKWRARSSVVAAFCLCVTSIIFLITKDQTTNQVSLLILKPPVGWTRAERGGRLWRSKFWILVYDFQTFHDHAILSSKALRLPRRFGKAMTHLFMGLYERVGGLFLLKTKCFGSVVSHFQQL